MAIYMNNLRYKYLLEKIRLNQQFANILQQNKLLKIQHLFYHIIIYTELQKNNVCKFFFSKQISNLI